MKLNVLIVDDSELMRAVLRKVLAMTKAPVGDIYEAENGQIALGVLEDELVDLVLTDINMPVMNGVELIKNIRLQEENENLPIIVISTEGSEKRMEEVSSLGIADYIRKPFTPERIKETLVKVWGDWGA
jgi:two-component system, chemotaxis family, chemotaxis protein CheY